MSLRIGCDLDGVLADFARAYRDVEIRLFGPGDTVRAGSPEEQRDQPATAESSGRDTPTRQRRRGDAVWAAIRATPDFWVTLEPIEPDAVRRLHAAMLRHRWEVFFITQRPDTAGDTVQRQTQRWLVRQGFDLPSVLVIPGSRGAAAGALKLDYHLDDSPTNCVDVKAESGAQPILIVPDANETTLASARQLGIGSARSILECLDLLEQASHGRPQPTLLARLGSLAGWR